MPPRYDRICARQATASAPSSPSTHRSPRCSQRTAAVSDVLRSATFAWLWQIRACAIGSLRSNRRASVSACAAASGSPMLRRASPSCSQASASARASAASPYARPASIALRYSCAASACEKRSVARRAATIA